jgi:hypothetical protein
MLIALRRARGKSSSTLLKTCAEHLTECMRISVISKVTWSGKPFLQKDRNCGRGTHGLSLDNYSPSTFEWPVNLCEF